MKQDHSGRSGLSTWKIAATYIGTIVGAGFASGQEVLQFFGYFGRWGIAGLAVATALFVIFGYIILELGRRLGAKSHLPVINYAGGRWIGGAVDGVITFFLFGALTVMAAGSGAIFTQEFSLPTILGSLAMLVVTALTVLVGISGVITAISYMVPILLAAVLGISLFSLISHPGAFWGNLAWSQADKAAAANWPLAALLYASYNLVVGVAVLAPLGALSRQDRLRSGALLGGLGLGLGALAITMALITNVPAALRYEVPMLFIAGTFSPAFRLGYSLVLLAEVYTTAVGSLYGFGARLTDPEKPAFRWVVLGASAAAFVAARFGFTRLIAVLFPLVGYAGLLLLGSLAYVMTKEYWPPAWQRFAVLYPAYRKRDRK